MTDPRPMVERLREALSGSIYGGVFEMGRSVYLLCSAAISHIEAQDKRIEKLQKAIGDIIRFCDGPRDQQRPDAWALLLRRARVAAAYRAAAAYKETE